MRADDTVRDSIIDESSKFRTRCIHHNGRFTFEHSRLSRGLEQASLPIAVRPARWGAYRRQRSAPAIGDTVFTATYDVEPTVDVGHRPILRREP
jgi:hypothetical protein